MMFLGGGAKLSERANDGVAGVVDIDSPDFHDSLWLSDLLGELRPTFLFPGIRKLTQGTSGCTRLATLAGESAC